MKRWLSVIGILAGLAVFGVSPGSAQGINLAWDNCGGPADRAFACDTNSGNNVLIASFQAPAGIDLFNSAEVIIDIKSSTDPLPDWWRLRNQTGQTGQCRTGAISANADFTSNTGCTDQWQGQGAGGIGTYRVGGPSPLADLSRVRLTMVFAVPSGSEVALTPGTEYYGAKIVVTNVKTVAPTNCADCATPMSITLNGIRVSQPFGSPGGNVLLVDPAASRSVTWQGGVGAPPVPTRSTTWGQVKSLYR